MDCIINNRNTHLCCDDGQKKCVKSNEIINNSTLYNDILYGCGMKPDENISMKQHTDPLGRDSYEWSRLGPLGYLREPKLYSIDTCSSHVATIENPIETKKWLRTIDDKYPVPLNIESISPLPSVDILRRINDDQLKSTYQTDFSYIDDCPWADYEKLMVCSGYNKINREKPREEIKCRAIPKPPYLNGHEIPGRRSKDSTTFASFDSKHRKMKDHNARSVGTNLPLRPVKPPRASLQSQHVDDDVDIGQSNFINHQSVRKQIVARTSNNNRRQINSGAIENKRKNILRSATRDNRRQIVNDSISETKDNTNDKNIGNIEQEFIDKKASNIRKNSTSRKANEEIEKNYQNIKESRKDIVANPIKIMDNGDELQLLSSIPWTSEYQDIISRTADDIIRNKLHYYGKLRLITPNSDCP